MQELIFFVGKGGVGKTTVSASYAVHTALHHPKERVLLLSTDPAHSLGDILQIELKDGPRAVPLRRGKLFGWQIDAERRFRKFLDQYREQILQIIDLGSLFTRQDIEPLIDSTVPGMAEISALLAIDDALQSRAYSRIVVDTAPFGHTLRLFALPEQFLRLLEFLELSASRDQILAAHFGGRAAAGVPDFLAKWRSMVEGILRALTEMAKVFVVTTAEQFSLNEAVRCRDILASYSPPVTLSGVVLNRVLERGGNCRFCRKRVAAAKKAQTFIARNFAGIPVSRGQDPGSPVTGVAHLAAFGAHVFEGKPLRLKAALPKTPALRFRKTVWPAVDLPLSFVLGKGGVGKTTITAGLGFATRYRDNIAVDLCSVDPAPSLDDIFRADIQDRLGAVFGDQHFRASEFDSAALFHRWMAELKSSIAESTTAEAGGIQIDLSFEHRLIDRLLDIVPPGVDEVLAMIRIPDLLNPNARVLIDMAPTGHGLELLRTPRRLLDWTRPLLKTLALHRTLAVAREAGVKIAELAHRLRELQAILNSHEQSQAWVVMLPELLPDRETERLLRQLREIGLAAPALFVNRVLLDPGDCAYCRTRAAWQRVTLSNLKRRYRGKLYVVPEFPEEIAGKSALKKLTDVLWQLA